jgi:hypothetical protein
MIMNNSYTEQTKKTVADTVVELYKTHKVLRYATYAAGGIVILFLLGQTFRVLASTAKHFNELKTAMKGS